MLIQFGTEVGNFFRETFVDKFDFWLVFGLVAQLLFAGRFLVQWISSERAGKSVIPFAFWIFSMGGGLMTLLYGIVKREPVIIFGQGVATLIYIRNIMLIYRRAATQASGRGSAARATAPPPARRSRVRDRRSGRRRPQARYGSAPPDRRATRSWRCARRRNRTESPGSRSRPRTRRCRTASARR